MNFFLKKILILHFILIPLSSQSSNIKRSTVSSASVDATSSSYVVNGTLGQTIIGLSSGNLKKISSGYWGWIARHTNLNVDEEKVVPNAFNIKPAYPNPFNPSTRIDMEIPDGGMVQITIYDVLGRIVMDHKKDYPSAGHYYFNWNPRSASGSTLATGTYLVMITHKNKINSQKITFLK